MEKKDPSKSQLKGVFCVFSRISAIRADRTDERTGTFRERIANTDPVERPPNDRNKHTRCHSKPPFFLLPLHAFSFYSHANNAANIIQSVRVISDFYFRKQIGSKEKETGRNTAENSKIESDTEMRRPGKECPQRIDAIGKRVESDDRRQGTWQIANRKKRARKEEEWHDDEVHDDLEALHILDLRCDCRSGCCEQRGYEEHYAESSDQLDDIFWTESSDHRNDKNDNALERGYGGSAQCSAEHDMKTWHRSDQRFFEESELPIPYEIDTGEDSGKDDAHRDDTRRQETDIAAFTSALKNGTESVSERNQK